MLPDSLPWLREEAPDMDVVISSRVRLARNWIRYPFPQRAAPEELQAVASALGPRLQEAGLGMGGVFALEDLSASQRAQLVGARVISPMFWESAPHRWALISADWGTAALINEEDHLRLQITRAGWQPSELRALHNQWEERLLNFERAGVDIRWAKLPQHGFLTASPINLGSGLRLGLLAHLMGLQRARRITRWLEALQALGCATRGLYGEGSLAFEGYVQISMLGNQDSLEELLARLQGTLITLIEAEREARAEISQDQIQNELHELMNTLQYTETLSLGTTLRALAVQRLYALLNETGGDYRRYDHWLFALAVYPPPEPAEVAVERAQWLRSQMGLEEN